MNAYQKWKAFTLFTWNFENGFPAWKIHANTRNGKQIERVEYVYSWFLVHTSSLTINTKYLGLFLWLVFNWNKFVFCLIGKIMRWYKKKKFSVDCVRQYFVFSMQQLSILENNSHNYALFSALIWIKIKISALLNYRSLIWIKKEIIVRKKTLNFQANIFDLNKKEKKCWFFELSLLKKSFFG